LKTNTFIDSLCLLFSSVVVISSDLTAVLTPIKPSQGSITSTSSSSSVLEVLFRVKDEDFSGDNSMGHILLHIDVPMDTEEGSEGTKISDQWCTIVKTPKHLAHDSDSESESESESENSDDGNNRQMATSIDSTFGELHISYKLIWCDDEDDNEEEEEKQQKKKMTSYLTLLQELQGMTQKENDEELEEVPIIATATATATATVASPNFTTSRVVNNNTDSTIVDTMHVTVNTSVRDVEEEATTYNGTVAQWWYVASDANRTVMGPCKTHTHIYMRAHMFI
jgi:hypothetical protein